MRDKRSEAQRKFDYAKHGWAFCNQAMLRNRVMNCEELARALEPNDKRFSELAAMQKALNGGEDA